MSAALSKAITLRLRGDETLTGAALTAQTALGALLGAESSGKPSIKQAAKGKPVIYPCIRFREDTGFAALGGVDVGIIESVIYRFELWEQVNDGSTLSLVGDYMEQLLDQRREAPALTLTSGKAFWCELFTKLQQPFYDATYNAYFGIIAFRFVEARY